MSDNVTRQTIPNDPRNPEDHLNSGYEDGTSDEFTIPPCGIADADGALKKLFFEDIGFTHKANFGPNKDITLKKPLIIFATGERWAQAKRLRPPRDRNSNLLLPAISIRRTSFEQTRDDITGRGINQTTGNLVIKRRLNEHDRDYQNLINKLAMKNLQNLPDSRRGQGEEGGTIETKQGGVLEPRLGNNVWEIISIPQPQFFTTSYEIVFWTSYTVHMNELIEKFVSSYLPQDRMFKLQTDKGYWFMAYVDEALQSADNFDDFKDSERLIRYNINMRVKGYILAPQGPTDQVPVRRWVSNPNISFDVSEYTEDLHEKKTIDRIQEDGNSFALTDIERDPATRQTPTFKEKLASKKVILQQGSGKKRTKYVSILESNEKKGETVYRASDLKALEEFLSK